MGCLTDDVCPVAEAPGGGNGHSPYARLEQIRCDLSGFPGCKFFRVEVGLEIHTVRAFQHCRSSTTLNSTLLRPSSDLGGCNM